MIQFTNPVFLWALAGLSIPLGIHLLSRKEGKVMRLGSLRHLEETSTQQFKGIRLNEILLLVLRCLLLLLFTLILSDMSWRQLRVTRWLLIEKGLEKKSSIQLLIDSLHEQGYQARLLAETFPLLKDSATVVPSVHYGKLIADLGAQNISDVIILAQNRVNNFKGLKTELPSNVRWISQSLDPLDYTLQTIQITPDSIILRQGNTSARETSFTSKKMIRHPDSGENTPRPAISIMVVGDEKYINDQQIIVASLRAIEKSIPIEIQLKEMTKAVTASSNTTDWCIWLSDKEIPDGIKSKILYLRPQLSNDIFVQEENTKWSISQRLDEDVALKENMTMKLASLIIPEEKLWETAVAHDRRMMPDSIAWPATGIDTTHKEASPARASANPYLLSLFLVLLLIERGVAYKRNQ